MLKSPLTLLLLALFMWTCQSPLAEENTSIVITGNIEEATEESIKLYSNFENEELKIEDGNFSVTLDRQSPNILSFYYKRNSIQVYAEPGDSVHIAFKEGDFEKTIAFSKDNEKENEFLKDFAKKMRIPGAKYKPYYTSTEEDFIAKIDSLKQEAQLAFNDFTAESTEDTGLFSSIIKEHMDYSAAEHLGRYPMYYSYFTKEKDYEPGEALKAAQNSVQLERPELLGIPAYANYLETNISNNVSALMKEDSSYQDMDNGHLTAYFKIISEEIENPEIAEFLEYKRMYSNMSYTDPNKLEAFYTAFMERSNNEFYKNNLETSFNEWAHLKPGLPAPDFKYPDIDSVMHALSDYKGKLVYVDVWATWCGPCLAEQPYLEEMEEEYEGNPNIVFMGVSIDEDKEAWKKMVVDKEMKGVQLLAYNAWKSTIAQDYNIGGIPRFLLIDQNGNIVSADAYRPSNDKLKKQFEDLLMPLKG